MNPASPTLYRIWLRMPESGYETVRHRLTKAGADSCISWAVSRGYTLLRVDRYVLAAGPEGSRHDAGEEGWSVAIYPDPPGP